MLTDGSQWDPATTLSASALGHRRVRTRATQTLSHDVAAVFPHGRLHLTRRRPPRPRGLAAPRSPTATGVTGESTGPRGPTGRRRGGHPGSWASGESPRPKILMGQQHQIANVRDPPSDGPTRNAITLGPPNSSVPAPIRLLYYSILCSRYECPTLLLKNGCCRVSFLKPEHKGCNIAWNAMIDDFILIYTED